MKNKVKNLILTYFNSRFKLPLEIKYSGKTKTMYIIGFVRNTHHENQIFNLIYDVLKCNVKIKIINLQQ